MMKTLVELNLRNLPKDYTDIYEEWLKANAANISLFEMIFWQRIGEFIQRAELQEKQERASKSFRALSKSSNPRTK